MLNDRLSKSELYNKQVLMETIKGRNKTAYEQISRQCIFNFLTTMMVAAVIVPMVVCRLFITSKLNVVEAPGKQLKALVNYKRCYVYESVIGLPLAAFGICFTLYLEHVASPLGIFFVALGFFSGLFCGWIGWRKHKSTMQEIEKNLAELEGLSD